MIFYENSLQKSAAEKSIAIAQKHFESKIVTTIEPLTNFYKAENYHQDYFRNNGEAPYCRFVIKPKVEKLQKKGIIK